MTRPTNDLPWFADPKALEDRLVAIDIVAVKDGDVQAAFERVKQMIFELRLDISRSAAIREAAS